MRDARRSPDPLLLTRGGGLQSEGECCVWAPARTPYAAFFSFPSLSPALAEVSSSFQPQFPILKTRELDSKVPPSFESFLFCHKNTGFQQHRSPNSVVPPCLGLSGPVPLSSASLGQERAAVPRLSPC